MLPMAEWPVCSVSVVEDLVLLRTRYDSTQALLKFKVDIKCSGRTRAIASLHSELFSRIAHGVLQSSGHAGENVLGVND
jgi:hypothetical protein